MEQITDTKQIIVRVSPAAHEAIQELARREKRSVTKQIEWLIEQAAAQAQPVPAPQEAATPGADPPLTVDHKTGPVPATASAPAAPA